MPFPFNAYLLAFTGAFLASLFSFPLWRKWSINTGLVDQPGHRKIHHTPVPLTGGLAVLTGFIFPILAATALIVSGVLQGPWTEPLSYGLDKRLFQLLAIVSGACGMVLLGWYDDRHTLKPLPKFSGQFLIALLVAASGIRITLFVDNVVFSYAITVLWILTFTNSLNFLDNMNGLCSGLGFIAASCFAMAAISRGQYLVAILALLIAGALLGFLPYNFPNAKAFLGDSGSHLVGYLMAVLAILPHFYSSDLQVSQLSVLSPLLILIVPIYDITTVIMIRLKLGKPIYEGDTNHISHRLVRRGLSKSTAVLTLWLIALAFGALSFFI